MQKAAKRNFGRIFTYLEMLRTTFTPNYFAFLLMRITGLSLVLYLILHLWSIGQIQQGSAQFDATMGAYNKMPFWLFEYLLLLAVLYHMLNGIRVIVADFFHLTERQAGMLWLVVAFSALAGAFSIPVFFPGIIPI